MSRGRGRALPVRLGLVFGLALALGLALSLACATPPPRSPPPPTAPPDAALPPPPAWSAERERALSERQPAAFRSWPPGATPREIGHRLASNLFPGWRIKRPHVHYAQDSAWLNALRFAELTGDEELRSALIRRFDPILAPGGEALISRVPHVDHAVFGIVPLEIARQSGDPRSLAIGLGLAEAQWEDPRADGLSSQARWWVDDLYPMISMLQVQAFAATGEARYLDRAALLAASYLDRLQRPDGLFHHGPEAPFAWGRGNGWAAGGLTELLLELPEEHPRRARLLEGYRTMMEALLPLQDAEGSWHQLLDHPESYAESSCTAMFTFAMVTGVKQGWLPEADFAPAARRGWLALVRQVDAQGRVAGVCIGTGQSDRLEHYLERPTALGDPHGQAAVLWCAVALLR